MRMLVRFHKDRSICEISHLDTMRAVQRALRRAQIPVQYSQGFHPHINLAFASALGVGISSEAEWMDVPLEQSMEESVFESLLAPQMPSGMQFEEAHIVDDRYPTLMSITAWADYDIWLHMHDQREVGAIQKELEAKTNEFIHRPILVMKKSKKGLKEVDIQPFIANMMIEVTDLGNNDVPAKGIYIKLRCVHASEGALNPLLLLPTWKEQCGISTDDYCDVVRTAMWTQNEGEPVPIWTLPKKSVGGRG